MAKTQTTPTDNQIMGLILAGTVVGRKCKTFPGRDGKPPRYVVIIDVNTGKEILSPERWCDVKRPTDLPEMNAAVAIPVRMAVFQTASGTRCTLQWGEDSKLETL